MNNRLFYVLGFCLFLTRYCLAQPIYIPPHFKGPIFFDLSGIKLKNQQGARVYRIYQVAGSNVKSNKHSKIEVAEDGSIPGLEKIEKGLYFYFEDHFISGEIKTQGHLWVTQQHQEEGLGLFSWKVHLKGECRWYHINGQLSQTGIYDGAEWYGDQKEYDQDGKLIKSSTGKPLSTYNYLFERTLLQQKTFSYTNDGQNNILPAAQIRPVDNDEIEVKPVDVAAKISSMPRFTIKNYRPYLGLYQGKTINTTLKKAADTSLEITEFIEKEGKVILELYTFGVFDVQAKLTGSVNDNVIFARGDWFISGEKVGFITIAAFLKREEGQLEGFFSLRPFEKGEQVQSCSFTLKKE